MEPYYNMKPSDSRNCRNPMRSNGNCSRPPMNKEPRPRMGRMEMECECKIKPKMSCHKMDAMEKLGDDFPVVMAYVPWQQWGDLYDAECGLSRGTMFKDLDFIFCGVRC